MRSLVTLVLSLLLIASANAVPSKNVLVIQEGTQNSPFAVLVIRELQKGFNSDPSLDVLLDLEYWDHWRFGDTSRQASALAIKYAGKKFDLIVSSGVAPFELLLDSGSKLFPGVPVLFLNLSDLHKPVNGWPANFTGIVSHIDYSGTIKLATKLQPDLDHIYYVLGDSAVDRRSMELIHEELETFDGRLEVSYWEHDSLGQLLTKVGDLPPRSAILFDEFVKEPDGQTHTPARVCSLLSLSSRAPVYAVYQTMVGNGAVGGVVGKLEPIARRAIEIGIALLHGAKTSAFPVENSQNEIMIDWRQFERFHLPERQLPSSATVLYRQPTIWQAHKQYIIGGISLCLAEGLLIFGLLWQRARRRKVEESLVERLTFESLLSDLSTTFINLPEEQIDSHMGKGLGRIAEFLKIERMTVYEFSANKTELTAACSWAREGVDSAPTAVKANQLPWWTNQVLRGEVLLASDTNALPEEASAEKVHFQKSGIVSAASVPLQIVGETIGAVSLVSTKRRVVWTEDLVKQLKVLAEIFSNALTRKRTFAELKLAEAVVHESEKRFRLVADTAPALIWMAGTDKLCTYFNKPWLDFTGRSVDLEIGNGWAEGIHSEDLQRCMDKYTQAFDRHEEFRMEYRLRRHDGEYRWVLDIGVPRFNQERSFVGYIGIGVDVTDHKQAETVLANVSRKLIEGQEQERTRIGRELHDDIGQRLAMLAVELEQLHQDPPNLPEVRSRMGELQKQASEIAADIQSLSHELHSAGLHYLGIAGAMRGFCHEFGEKQKVEIDFKTQDLPSPLSPELSLCFFRVLQEALHNSAKHSGVRHFEVRLWGASDEIHLTIRDSGAGFELEEARKGRGLGLISMEERLKLLNGTFSIESQPQRGTTIHARVQLRSGSDSMRVAG
jgi:PAS domain S-box-containing protein